MPEPTLPRCPTLVLAIDGLRAAALGAYGQTAYETPTFDRLTTEAITYGEAFAPTPDPRDLYARLAAGGSIPAGSVLVTDDPGATEPAAAAFERVVVVDSPTAGEVASTFDQTVAAAVWGEFAVALVEAVGGAEPTPPLIWFHTRGLHGPWDAPPASYASLIDDEDPEVPSEATRPEGPTDHEDARFAASCRYAGQVITLDACLAGWLDVADGLFEGEEHRLIVAGMRGYALGEHGRIGLGDGRLFSELQQVPLFVRESDLHLRFCREAAPVLLDQVLAGRGVSHTEPLLLASKEGAAAVITAERLLRRPADPAARVELYVKPDDRWEQNDIASLEPGVVDELLAYLSGGGDSAVAAPTPDP